MALYHRVDVRTMFTCIILVTAATIVFQHFSQHCGDRIESLKLLKTRLDTRHNAILALPKQTTPPKIHHSINNEPEIDSFCTMYSSAYKYLKQPDVLTDLTDWTYKRIWKCPKFDIPNTSTIIKRLKYSLSCFDNKAKLVPSFTKSSADIQTVGLNNTCLASFIDSCCTDHRGTPNVVHYVWYFREEMKFYMFLSMMGVIRFIKPCLILFHGEFLPYGKYWDYIVRIYPNILHIKRIRPLTIFGKKVHFHEHSGDFMRIEAVKTLGGIYFDADVIILRDLEPLREYDMTLCLQENRYLHSAFIMAKKNATFLNLWMDGYRKDFRNESYTYNAMEYNKVLAIKRTDLIHVENGTLCAPNELVGIGKSINPNVFYNWSSLYGYHIYTRRLKVRSSLDVNFIKNFSTTLGSMARHIVYGNKEICE